MISVNLNWLDITRENMKRVRTKVAERGDAAFRQKIYYLLEAAVRVSPQFSGDFASNWAFSVNGNMPIYRPIPGKLGGLGTQSKTDAGTGRITYQGIAHKAGDPEAVQIAMMRGAAALRGVTLKSKIHLVNSTDLHTDGTRMIGRDGTVNLRPENIIPGRVRIESYVRAIAKNPVKLVVP